MDTSARPADTSADRDPDTEQRVVSARDADSRWTELQTAGGPNGLQHREKYRSAEAYAAGLIHPADSHAR